MFLMLLIGKLKSYATMIVLAGGLGFVGFAGGYIKGRIDAAEGYKLAQARAERDAARRDLAIQKHVTEQVTAERDALTARDEKLSQEVKDYEAELAKRGDGGACRLNDADVQRLQRIR